MTNLIDFIQLGVGGIAVVVVWFVVKRFLDSIDKKDKQVMEIVERFDKTITNHFHEDLESREKLRERLEQMGKKIEKSTSVTAQLLKWLRKINNKK